MSGRSRKLTALARLREHPNLGEWETVIGRVTASPYHRGDNDRGWRADFEYLVRTETFDKFLTGSLSQPARGRRPTQAVRSGVDYDNAIR